MRFIDFLLQNPFVAIVVLIWLFGIFGQVFKRAARSAQEAAKRAREPGREEIGRIGEEADADRTLARSAPDQAGRSTRTQPTPEEIAAEIRRMMGLETADHERHSGQRRSADVLTKASGQSRQGQARQGQSRQGMAKQRTARPTEGTTQRVKRGSLRETLEQRGKEGRYFGTVEDHHLDVARFDRLKRSKRKTQQVAAAPVASRESRFRDPDSRRVPLDDVARAFILREVLGPPLAMRPNRDF